MQSAKRTSHDIDVAVKSRTDQSHVEAQLAAAKEVLRASEARYRAAFETSLDAIAICRIDDGMFVDVNRAFFDILGYSRDELVSKADVESYTCISSDGTEQTHEFIDLSGASSEDLRIWCDPDEWTRLTEIVKEQASCRDYEARLRTKNGEVIYALISAAYIEIEGVPCIHFVTRDISTYKAAEDKIHRLSYYDPLTSLPNQFYLQEQLDRLLAAERKDAPYHAFLLIDLDRYGEAVGAYGIAAGHELLRQSARRIIACIRDETDTVGKLGAVRFALSLKELGSTAEEALAHAKDIANRIRDALGRPYELYEHTLTCTASVGITVFCAGAADADSVLQQSTIALKEARNSGQNIVGVFAPELQDAVRRRSQLETELRCALEQDQFQLYYQPLCSVDQCIGAEALIRWNHPTRGLLTPGAFLSVAESAGMIQAIGEWAMRAACRQAAEWRKNQYITDAFKIAVNISAHQFRSPEFVAEALRIIGECGADAKNIEIELTESALIEDINTVAQRMQELRSNGLQISLDDFGTGYSCLSYLRRLPLDKLKIDISFIRDLLTDQSCSDIVQTIINLSKSLGLEVLAEGVETKAQQEHLYRLGCKLYQGFLFSRPIPASQFITFIFEQ
jgi:diguanylate cyclase (GGDEF)-like protein